VFALEVDYLLGRAFAANFRDQGKAEWPPAPGRLFTALAAAYFESGVDPTERRALEWLEQLPPPAIGAGEAGDPVIPETFVPTNYTGDGPPVLRGKQPRQFPAQAPSDARVYFVWREAQAPNELEDALDRLAARVGYLGRACSLVRMRLCSEYPEPNYEPHPSGAVVIRVPSKGRLDELRLLFETDRRPSAGAQARYRRTDAGDEERPIVESEFGQMFVMGNKEGPGLPIEGALTLTQAVRAALMSIAGENDRPIPPLLHGHDHETHCAIVALPFVGRQHADGRLMGFGIVFPRLANTEEKRQVLAPCAELQRRGLRVTESCTWTVEAATLDTIKQALRPATWAQPARVWRSATPILLDRFPKKNGPTVEDLLKAACRRIHLPDPIRIEHGPYSVLDGVPPVPVFRLRRNGDDRPRWGVHAELEFPAQVRGPVILGAGRYFGMGLMRPEREARDGGN
jgi:CRISPR-associated protein Csb2